MSQSCCSQSTVGIGDYATWILPHGKLTFTYKYFEIVWVFLQPLELHSSLCMYMQMCSYMTSFAKEEFTFFGTAL